MGYTVFAPPLAVQPALFSLPVLIGHGRSRSRSAKIGFIKNPTTQVVAWHPYPTALRIVNWCKSAFDDAVILESLYRQAAFLYRNPGNLHLRESSPRECAGARRCRELFWRSGRGASVATQGTRFILARNHPSKFYQMAVITKEAPCIMR